MERPPFREYYPSEDTMDAAQRRFYDWWREQWGTGVAVDVGEDISYVFAYVYEQIARATEGSSESACGELVRLQKAYPGRLGDYIELRITDVLVLAGRLPEAIERKRQLVAPGRIDTHLEPIRKVRLPGK